MSLVGFEQIIFALDSHALLLHNYDKLSRIFLCILLKRNHMIFLVQARAYGTYSYTTQSM